MTAGKSPWSLTNCVRRASSDVFPTGSGSWRTPARRPVHDSRVAAGARSRKGNVMSAIPRAILDRRTTYDRYLEGERIPIIEDFYLRDLSGVEVASWERTGALGAIVRLEGAQMLDDSYVLEIPPGVRTIPQRHLYEELVYIVSGTGTTTVWNDQGTKVTFEWRAGSLFAIPLNTSYQHCNTSGTESVRYYAVTNAPLMMNLFHNQDFIFNQDYDFVD